MAIATPLVLLLGLELRGALVADAGGQFTPGTYLALRRWTMLGAAVVLALIVAWHATRAGARLSFLLILAGVFAGKVLWTVAEVGWGLYQRRERLDLLARSLGLRGLALVVPFAVLLPLYNHLSHTGQVAPSRLAEGTALAVFAYALGLAAVWHWYDRPRVADPRQVDLATSTPAIRALAAQTLPLGLVALTINLCDTLPRLVIESQADGKTQLGYYGALAYVTLVGNLVVVQAATAASNRLSRHYQTDMRAFLRLGACLVATALAVGVFVVLLVTFCGHWLLRTLYTAEYAQFTDEFRIIVLAHALGLLTSVCGAATTQMRLFWVQVPAQVVTLAATAVAAILLIPGEQPVRGAALTALVRAVVQFVLYGGCVGAGIALRRRILGHGAAQVPPAVGDWE